MSLQRRFCSAKLKEGATGKACCEYNVLLRKTKTKGPLAPVINTFVCSRKQIRGPAFAPANAGVKRYIGRGRSPFRIELWLLRPSGEAARAMERDH